MPRVLLFTGDGKGKTTAAMGMVLRAAGHNMRVCIIQFIKNKETGEDAALSLLPQVELLKMGQGFVPDTRHADFPAHRDKARQALQAAAEKIRQKACDLLVLDEINTACACHLLEAEEVAELIREIRGPLILVLTGRDAPEILVDLADTVTVMECRKHGFAQGIAAEKGVEY
ncbi:MAG: cob(I)yrinic acid a,c-diamide adenosyltransferase [Syntrophobacterales bacterium]|jgi:cob(I)alamin adenosyltransferase|nr:cob(I)yrinic acid a,c-diamide adenosyltransferase [Syntrophobacterales bacterium]